MKTTAIRIVFATIIFATTSIFSATAQDFFLDKKWEDGKLTSIVKYELGYSGLYEKSYYYEYTYDSSGNLLQEDVSKWDRKKSDWQPDYRILRKTNPICNTAILEYITWNTKEKKYNEPSEKMLYQLDDSKNELSYLAFIKGNKVMENIHMEMNNSDDSCRFAFFSDNSIHFFSYQKRNN